MFVFAIVPWHNAESPAPLKTGPKGGLQHPEGKVLWLLGQHVS